MPPCIVAIGSDLSAGRHVGHTARFSYAAMAIAAGESVDEVVAHFRHEANFSQDKSLKIVQQMADRQYTPPNCDKMAADGLCVNQVPLCSHITNPISFLRAKRGASAALRQEATFPTLYRSICQCGWTPERPLDARETRLAAVAHEFGSPETEMHQTEYFDLNGRPAKPWLSSEWE